MRFIYTKTFLAFMACLVFVVFLFFLQAKGFLYPLSEAFLEAPRPVVAVTRAVARPIKSFFSTIYSLRQIARDNSDLKQQVMGLSHQMADYDQLKKENDALRKELGFVGTVKFSLIPCAVLSANPEGLADTLALSCGTDQGVKDGQAVLSQGYLVAKIIYADKGGSTALLATDSNFTADAQLSKTGAAGLVVGSYGSGLLLDRLSQGDDLSQGWMVVTAGINNLVPKGILIGQVDQVVSSSNDLFKKATVLTPVDFNNLDFVFVSKP